MVFPTASLDLLLHMMPGGICEGIEAVWEGNVVGISRKASSFLLPFNLVCAKGHASLSMTCVSENIRDAWFIQLKEVSLPAILARAAFFCWSCMETTGINSGVR